MTGRCPARGTDPCSIRPGLKPTRGCIGSSRDEMFRPFPASSPPMRLPHMRPAVRSIMYAVALLAGAPHVAGAQEPYFPESAFFPADQDLNSIVVEHLA